MRTRPDSPRVRRAGRALVELLVAAGVLAVGGTGVARALVAAERAQRAARRAEAAEGVLATRLTGWVPGACAPSEGARRVGALRERWTVTVEGGLATLADTVEQVDDASAPRAGGVAVAPCAP